jgi:large repetitive protein
MRALRTSLATLAVLAVLPAVAHAAAFTVNDTGNAPDAAPGDGQCATAAHTCTLRAATEEIDAAGAASNAITLPSGTINTNGLDITANTSITGQGASATIIDGTNNDTSDPVFKGGQNTLELAGLTVTNAPVGVVGGSLTGLTLSNAAITGNAGDPVIDLAPTGAGTAMVVDHSSITKNTGQTIDVDPSDGDGTLTMRDSTFSDNTSGEEGASQLIDIDPSDGNGELTIQRTTMERNTIADFAQGIIDFDPSGDTLDSTIDITDSTFRANTTGGNDGLLQVDPSANDAGPVAMTIARSLFDGNGTGNGDGGVIGFYAFEDGSEPSPVDLTISDSTFTDNFAGTQGSGFGGAIDWEQPALPDGKGRLVISGSTFAGNHAGSGDANGQSAGGAISFDGGALEVVNSTFNANRIDGTFFGDGGGAVFVFPESSTATFTDSTIDGNQATGRAFGGGIAAEEFDRPTRGRHARSAAAAPSSDTPVVITGSIVAGNTEEPAQDVPSRSTAAAAATEPSDCAGLIGSGGHNIESADTCDFDQTGDQQNSDPKVAALADNGGPTATMAIGKESPAFDKGGDACEKTDQRGVTRPQFAHCDIGAFELAAPAPPAPSPTPTKQTSSPPPPQGAVAGVTVHKCVSRRHFRIRLRVPRGAKVVSATVRLRGHRVAVHRGKRLTAVVNLRHLPKGRFSLTITLRLADGSTIKGVRRYHTCHKAIPPQRPPKV